MRLRVALAVVVLVAGVVAAAQEGGRFRGRGRRAPVVEPARVDYDGRFAFVRLRYREGGGFFGGDPGWAHDYPRAERNFMRILEDLTLLRVHRDRSNIFTLDDPELGNYPVAYMSEPGYWTMNEAELEGIRAYLAKGGFLIFDDFRGEHWYNFEEQMRRVVPDGRLVELDAANPIFHSFFEINDLDEQIGYYGRATFYGMYEGNDPARRLMLIANYNHDIGEFWEYSDTGFVPIALSNEAYKLGVNYVMYGMTH
ncbi:MAG: DUF4159 domain-containing protein [Acidobacteriota bacterium]